MTTSPSTTPKLTTSPHDHAGKFIPLLKGEIHGLPGDVHRKRVEDFDLNIFLAFNRVPEGVLLYSDGVKVPRNEGAEAIVMWDVLDGHAPDFGWDEMEALIVKYLRQGKRVAISCFGGHGRTGTIIAALVAKYHVASEAADFDPITFVREAICPKCVEAVEQIQWIEEVSGWSSGLTSEADLRAKYLPKAYVWSGSGSGNYSEGSTAYGSFDNRYDTFDKVEACDVKWTGPTNNRRPYAIVWSDLHSEEFLVRLYHHAPKGIFIGLRDCPSVGCKGLIADAFASEDGDADITLCLACGSEEVIGPNRAASARSFWDSLVKEGVLTMRTAIDSEGKVQDFFALADWPADDESIVVVRDDAPKDDVLLDGREGWENFVALCAKEGVDPGSREDYEALKEAARGAVDAMFAEDDVQATATIIPDLSDLSIVEGESDVDKDFINGDNPEMIALADDTVAEKE